MERAPVLRLKRRRDENPVDQLVIEANLSASKKRPPMSELEKAMATLTHTSAGVGSLEAVAVPQVKRVRFKRVASVLEAEAWSRTLADKLRLEQHARPTAAGRSAVEKNASEFLQDKVALQAAQRSKVSRSTSFARRRAMVAPMVSDEVELRRSFRIYDIFATGTATGATVAAAAGTDVHLVRRRAQLFRPHDSEAAEARARFIPLAVPNPGRILNPFQRQLDESIWVAFTTGDLGPVFTALRGGAEVNYQRLHSDLTTALMAAAFHGDARATIALLRLGALARIADASGRSAARIAEDRGHVTLAALLRDVQHEEEEDFAAAVSSRPGAMSAAALLSSGPSVGAGSETEFAFDVFVAMEDDVERDAVGSSVSAAATSHAGVGSFGPSLSGPQLLRLDELSLASLWGVPDSSGYVSDDDDNNDAWDAESG